MNHSTTRLLIASALLFSIQTISPSDSFAEGGGHVGGGDGFSCMGEKGLSDIDLDRLNFIPDEIFDFTTDDVVFESLLSYLDQTNQQLAQQVRDTKSHLTFSKVKKIPNADTGVHINFWEFLDGCSRHQYALQNFDKNIVYLKEKDYGQLHPLIQGLLQLHEIFIKMEFVPSDTLRTIETRARKRLADIFNAKDFNRVIIAEVSKYSTAEHSPSEIMQSWLRKLVTFDPKTMYADKLLNRATRLPETLWERSRTDQVTLEMELLKTSFDEVFDAGFDVNGKNSHGVPFFLTLYPKCFSDSEDRRESGYPEYYSSLSYVIEPMINKHGMDLDQLSTHNQPILIQLFSRYGLAPIEMLTDVEDDYGTALVHLNYNVYWCKPGSKEGDYAVTLLDLALQDHSKYDKYAADFFRRHGVKTGQEAGITCHAVPAEGAPDPYESSCKI